MFVQNCEVKVDEVVATQVQKQQGRRNRKRRAGAGGVDDAAGAAVQQDDEGVQHEQEVLHPVCCAVCGTEVGAQDADEIVHFYQVLASEC